MAETTTEATPETATLPAEPAREWSAADYLAARRKGADPQTAAKAIMSARQPEPVAAPPAEAPKAEEVAAQPETESTDPPAGEEPKEEEPKPGEDPQSKRRISLIEDVARQRNRAQEAERLLAEERSARQKLNDRLDALEKGVRPVESVKAEPAKAEPTKLVHPGEAPDFLKFDSIAEFNKANADYISKLVTFQTATMKEELLGLYQTSEAEKTEKAKKDAVANEKQTAISRFTSAVMDAEKRPGYEGLGEKLRNPALAISDAMMDILSAHPKGVDIGKYLVDHPDEATRIFHMKRHADIGLAMGEIAGSVKPSSSAPPSKVPEAKPKTSGAPPPPATVAGGGKVANTLQEVASAGDFLQYKARRKAQGYGPTGI